MITVAAITQELERAERPLRTPALRGIAKDTVTQLNRESADPESVFALCGALIDPAIAGGRTVSFEIAHQHRGLRDTLDIKKLEHLGRTLDGWDSVDHFARKLSGPAWRRGQISDAHVLGWARSEDFWWRRAGIVSTIALNERQEGKGDAARTLAVCELFIDDRAHLHVKALSWALRVLGQRDPDAVTAFLEERHARLAPLVIREVQNKLSTGHKMAKPSEAMRERMQARVRT